MGSSHPGREVWKPAYEWTGIDAWSLWQFLGDDIFVLIAAELDARMLGRLGCAAQRFWRPSVPDPAHTAEARGGGGAVVGGGGGGASAAVAQGEQVRGWVCRGGVGGSWLRALGEAEKLQRPLRWTAHHEETSS